MRRTAQLVYQPRLLSLVLTLALTFSLSAVSAGRAQEAGQIYGTVTDVTGGVLPGVTVTLTGPRLLQPRLAVTTQSGTYQFPGLGPAEYSVRFELAGFRTIVREQVRIEIGFNAQVGAQMQVAGLEESVLVVGESPVLDVRSTSQGATFSTEALNALPTTRDVFNVYQQAPAVTVNITNVGGSTAGNQASFATRAATIQQNRTFRDGVETGTGGTASPFYLDYDSVEEMQISTGGADITMQTSGAVISIVSKSGTNRLRGSGQLYVADKRFASTNINQSLREQGASAGNPLLNFKDFGIELGGPIKRNSIWFWANLGRQTVNTGVIGFYRNTPDCEAVRADDAAFSVPELRDCLNAHTAELTHVNYAVSFQPFRNNTFTLRNSYDYKFEDLRGANDNRPPEATTVLGSATSAKGARFWNSGWPPTWRFADQHIVSDRWVIDGGFGHYCQCLFIGAPEDTRDIQPAVEVSSGRLGRSDGTTNDQILVRNNIDVSSTYFLPSAWGGNHSFKVGFKYLFYRSDATSGRPAGVDARFNSGVGAPPFTTPFAARFYWSRELVEFFNQQSLWFQDTYSRNRFTLALGVRWDRQTDSQGASSAAASPFTGEISRNGQPFNFLPELAFAGIKGVPVWQNVAPRVGVTYDVGGKGTTALKGSFAVYYEQRALAGGGHILSSALNTVGAHFVEFPWADLNGDKLVQMNEVDTGLIRSFGGGYDPADPTGAAAVSANEINPDIKAPYTTEFVVGVAQ